MIWALCLYDNTIYGTRQQLFSSATPQGTKGNPPQKHEVLNCTRGVSPQFAAVRRRWFVDHKSLRVSSICWTEPEEKPFLASGACWYWGCAVGAGWSSR